MSSKTVSMILDIESYKTLVKLAKEDERSFSSYVRKIITDYLKSIG